MKSFAQNLLPPFRHQHLASYWTTLPGRSAGVGFLVSSKLSKHIFDVSRFQSHLIALHMEFQGHIQVTFIQVYLPSSSTERNSIKQTLTKWIVTEQRKHRHVFIMGDFNA